MKRAPEQPAALEKRAQPGKLRAIILALFVHALFFGFIIFGVTWQSSPTPPVEAELWDKLPPVAAKPPPQPEPPPPEPPKPEPPKPEATTPPAVEKVQIPIESTPEADVFIGDEKKGTTPYTLELDKTAKPVEIKLVAKGFHSDKRKVAPTDTKIAVKLKAKSGGTKPTGTTPTGTTTSEDTDDTMNPFAKKKQ